MSYPPQDNIQPVTHPAATAAYYREQIVALPLRKQKRDSPLPQIQHQQAGA